MTVQVHKFRAFDKNIVLDVNSGSVLQVDDTAYELLNYYGQCPREDIFEKMKDKYSQSVIEETLKEIKSWKNRDIFLQKRILTRFRTIA